MKERIQKFIDNKGIQPGELAIMLEVQRSNISHILNGRNKPGASFIEKMLLVFPELNARWLLTGEGNMTYKPDSIKESNVHGVKSVVPEVSITKEQTERKKTIEKVILLHNDGSFSAFDK